jgi:hypothetical protein
VKKKRKKKKNKKKKKTRKRKKRKKKKRRKKKRKKKERKKKKKKKKKKKREMGWNVKCPCQKSDRNSALEGPLSNPEDHVKWGHSYIVKRGSTFHCKAVRRNVLLIACNGETFLYYKHVTNNANL